MTIEYPLLPQRPPVQLPTPKVYSVEIFSPENRASGILPLEVDRDTAARVAETFKRVTHLEAALVCREQWSREPGGAQ